MVFNPQWFLFGFSILTSLFNCALFVIIKFNDMKHFHDEFLDFKNLNRRFGDNNKRDHEKIMETLTDVSKRVAIREEICEERHHKKR